MPLASLPAFYAIPLWRPLPDRVAFPPRRPDTRRVLRLNGTPRRRRRNRVSPVAVLRGIARNAVADQRRRAHRLLGAVFDAGGARLDLAVARSTHQAVDRGGGLREVPGARR